MNFDAQQSSKEQAGRTGLKSPCCSAGDAASLLKGLANERRLILCVLAEGECRWATERTR
jgi:hypothetical protein